jgi:hypothetical protein
VALEAGVFNFTKFRRIEDNVKIHVNSYNERFSIWLHAEVIWYLTMKYMTHQRTRSSTGSCKALDLYLIHKQHKCTQEFGLGTIFINVELWHARLWIGITGINFKKTGFKNWGLIELALCLLQCRIRVPDILCVRYFIRIRISLWVFYLCVLYIITFHALCNLYVTGIIQGYFEQVNLVFFKFILLARGYRQPYNLYNSTQLHYLLQM